MPRTIGDATELILKLGEIHLRVDALYVAQDDDEDKSRYIRFMANFYSKAVLTIVAGTGDNAHSGLASNNSHRNSSDRSIDGPNKRDGVTLIEELNDRPES